MQFFYMHLIYINFFCLKKMCTFYILCLFYSFFAISLDCREFSARLAASLLWPTERKKIIIAFFCSSENQTDKTNKNIFSYCFLWFFCCCISCNLCCSLFIKVFNFFLLKKNMIQSNNFVSKRCEKWLIIFNIFYLIFFELWILEEFLAILMQERI